MSGYGVNLIDKAMLSNQNSVMKIDKKMEDKALREQTDAFESIIVKMVLDNAAKDEKNLFSEQNDPGDKIYKAMYRDELAKTSSGSFGFSKMLYDFLSEKR